MDHLAWKQNTFPCYSFRCASIAHISNINSLICMLFLLFSDLVSIKHFDLTFSVPSLPSASPLLNLSGIVTGGSSIDAIYPDAFHYNNALQLSRQPCKTGLSWTSLGSLYHCHQNTSWHSFNSPISSKVHLSPNNCQGSWYDGKVGNGDKNPRSIPYFLHMKESVITQKP